MKRGGFRAAFHPGYAGRPRANLQQVLDLLHFLVTEKKEEELVF
jgi:hypothetical protein